MLEEQDGMVLTSERTRHHGACCNGVTHWVEVITDPFLPVRIRAVGCTIWNVREAGDGLSRGQCTILANA